MYKEELQKIGLTNGEARIYLALLSLNSSTVGPIVKKSSVAYSKVYEVLERLIEKGLVSYTIKEKTKYFQALEPSRLKEYLEKKEKEIIENKQLINKIIPNLIKITSNESRCQESEVFVGEKGIKTAYEILLRNTIKRGSLRFFYIHNKKYDKQAYNFYFGIGNLIGKLDNFIKKNKIEWKGLENKEDFGHKLADKFPKYMPVKSVNFPIPGNIDIGESMILITAWSEKPIGILIKSKEVADNFKNYFEGVWKTTK